KKNSSSSAEGDVFWVVYDQEYLTPQSISCHQKAWNKANRNGINIAISCVCFELWLLLHFGYTTRSFSSYDNLISSSPLKKLIANYDKGSKLTYLAIRERIGAAKDNARKLDVYAKANYKNTHEPYQFPCYTSFHKLLEAIDGF
ncbi:RloB family protein, partial [Cronobacter turicensis]